MHVDIARTSNILILYSFHQPPARRLEFAPASSSSVRYSPLQLLLVDSPRDMALELLCIYLTTCETELV
jgi:hypothetical protein